MKGCGAAPPQKCVPKSRGPGGGAWATKSRDGVEVMLLYVVGLWISFRNGKGPIWSFGLNILNNRPNAEWGGGADGVYEQQ